jgi:hypothetical protein
MGSSLGGGGRGEGCLGVFGGLRNVVHALKPAPSSPTLVRWLPPPER